MIKYFQTTTLILLWCFVITLLYSWVKFYWVTRNPDRANTSKTQLMMPGLVIGPVLMVLFFNLFGKNLIFPVHFFSSMMEIVQAAFFPGFILVLSSGLVWSLSKNIQREYSHWSQMRFFLVAKGMGKDQNKSLRRLVLLKSVTSSWSHCLPWLFGELIIVESVFNAPGLGLDAWHLARTRDMAGLAEVIFYLALLYGVCVAISTMVSRWVGHKLESYGS